jgi:glycosyltransferase involved in cell wall biosynthesis/O-antigen/teichoic acid export membrane protein
MSYAQRFIQGAITGVGGYAVKIGLNLAIIPILIQSLGAEAFGFYMLLIGISDLISGLDLGLTNGLIYKLSGHHEKDDLEGYKLYAGLGNMLYTGLALFLVVLGYFGSGFVAQLVQLSPAFKAMGGTALAFIFFEAAILIYNCYARSLLMAHSLYLWPNLMEALRGILINGTCVVLLWQHFGFLDLLMARVIILAGLAAFLFYQARKVEPKLPLFHWAWDGEAFASLFKVSGSSLIIQLCSLLSTKTDMMIIGTRLSMVAIGSYTLSNTLIGQVCYVSNKLLEGIFPIYNRLLQHPDDSAELPKVFLTMSNFSFSFIGCLLLGILIYYPDFFAYLSKGRFAYGEAYSVILWMIPLVWGISLVAPSSMLLFAKGVLRFHVVCSILATIANVVVSWLLVEPLGLMGVAMGACIPHSINHFLLIIPKAIRQLGLSYWDYIYTVVIRSLFPLLTTVGLTYLLHETLGPLQNNWLGHIAGAGAIVVVWGVLWYFFGTTTYAQETLKQAISRRLPTSPKLLTPEEKRALQAANEVQNPSAATFRSAVAPTSFLALTPPFSAPALAESPIVEATAMSEPVFSVIIPLYNAQAFIVETINSVLAQTEQDFEILVVDDGSPDDSVALIQRTYPNESRLIIIRQANRGLAGARNTGIRYAKGQFLAFLDADDLWRPNKLAKHRTHLEANPKLGLSFTQSEFLSVEGRPLGQVTSPVYGNVSVERILTDNPIASGSAPAMRRSALEAISVKGTLPNRPADELWYFDERLRRGEDCECWVRLLSHSDWEVACINQPLTLYRINAASLSSDYAKQASALDDVLASIANYAPAVMERYGVQAKAYLNRYIARSALRQQEGEAAVAYINKALSAYPAMFFKEPARTASIVLAAYGAKYLPASLFQSLYSRGVRTT